MNKALVIGLFPSVEARRSLLATMVCFNRASNWLLDTIGEGEPARRLALQKHYYTELRRRFGLPAQMAIRCISRVFDVCRSAVVPVGSRFRDDASLPYDPHLVSFKGLETVSLLTVSGRMTVPSAVLGYVPFRLSSFKHQSQVILGSRGQWQLLYNVPLPTGINDALLPVYDGLPVFDVLDQISMFGAQPRDRKGCGMLRRGGGNALVLPDSVVTALPDTAGLGNGLGDSGDSPVLLEDRLAMDYGLATDNATLNGASREEDFSRSDGNISGNVTGNAIRGPVRCASGSDCSYRESPTTDPPPSASRPPALLPVVPGELPGNDLPGGI